MARSIAIAVFAAMLSLTASLGAHAAGLGRLNVLSPLGQPLNAEIEIVSLQPGEEDGLAARLASIEAFRQAGIEYNPTVLGMRFAIERRDGRPIVRVRTTQPVNEPFVDLLVELQWSTGRLVREYTFLLDPPEYREKAQAAIAAAPAAPAAPAAKPEAKAAPTAPAPKMEARPLGAAPSAPAKPSATYEVKKGDTLAGIARQHAQPGVSLNQMLIAIYRANQDAFMRENMNLLRSGRILNIPGGEDAGSVGADEANRLVQSQTTEFSEYRRRLAAAPTAADGARGQREVAGRIEGKPRAEPPAESQDQLRLSKVDPGRTDGAGSRAARGDDRVAANRAQKEAESRVADLEKNVADLQKLLEMRNQQLAELEKKAGAKPAPAPATPAPTAPAPKATEAPKPAAEAAKPAADAPKPAAEAPKPAAEAPKAAPEAPKPVAEAPKPAPEAKKADPKAAPKPAPKKAAPPPPEPSLVDEFLDNPMYLGLLGGVILLLIGYGAYAWKRKKASQARFQDSVLGGTGVDGAAGSAPALSTAAAAGAASASLASVSQPAGMAAEEVDPIAEADVYMAYGRDAQAEEILKEALAKDSSRVPVMAKLCEIYANRRDTKSFEQTALKVKSQTNGAGPEWEKVAALGRGIDPQNGVYGSGAVAAVAPAAAAAAAAAPTLDFDLGGATTPPTAPDITLDDGPKDASAATIDFDLGAATTPPAAPAEEKKDEKSDFTPEGTLIMGSEPAADQTASSGGLDFDLGLGDTKKEETPPPAPVASAPAPAAEPSGLDFDLNLDLGTPDTPAEPATAAPEPSASSSSLDMDLSSISLDLGPLGEPSAPAAGSGDPKWQEVATKLDLAKAYEEMGDKDGARELLNEVMKDGDAAQQGQAQQLLAKLG